MLCAWVLEQVGGGVSQCRGGQLGFLSDPLRNSRTCTAGKIRRHKIMRDFRRVAQKSRCLVLLVSAAPLLFGADKPQKAPAGMSKSAAEAAKAQMNRNFGKMPMSFEENRGQADRQVQFLSQGQGYSMFLTSSGVVLSLQTPASPSKPGQHALIRMGFSGAKSAAVTGEEQQTAKSSYFVGNDPAKWVSGAANYARVRYRALYPGVDLVFYRSEERRVGKECRYR